MPLFKRKEKVIDLSERMYRQQERMNQLKADLKAAKSTSSDNLGQAAPSVVQQSIQETPGSFFNFFGSSTSSEPSSPNTSSTAYSESDIETEKKKKLAAKRLADLTSRLEEISTKIYKIEQRLDLIERKMGIEKY